jgi:hypothetical protein
MNQTPYLRSTVAGNSVRLAPPTSLLVPFSVASHWPEKLLRRGNIHMPETLTLIFHLNAQNSHCSLFTAQYSSLSLLSLCSTLLYPLRCSTSFHPTAPASRYSIEISISTTRYGLPSSSLIFARIPPSFPPLSPIFTCNPLSTSLRLLHKRFPGMSLPISFINPPLIPLLPPSASFFTLLFQSSSSRCLHLHQTLPSVVEPKLTDIPPANHQLLLCHTPPLIWANLQSTAICHPPNSSR